MTTDFSYNGKTIVTSGAIRPSGRNTPTDARGRVVTKADIADIPLPSVGLLVYVEDEAKFYVIGGLKADTMGTENMLVDMDKVVALATGGSSTGGGVDEATVKSICAEYHTENTVTKTVTASEFADDDNDGIYEVVVSHNLNTTTFSISILDSNNSAVYEVYDIVNANNIKIYNDKAENLTVTIRK